MDSADAGPLDIARIQRRTLIVLSSGQVLSGVGIGSVISLGALLAEHISGQEAASGLAATMMTLGAAAAAIPLARIAAHAGRRVSLATGGAASAAGGALTIFSASLGQFWLTLVALLVLGAGAAVNLQARFAAADLAAPERRGRDLSLVVWATTIGVAVGPNLIEPGELLGAAIGLPVLTGGFAIAVVTQLAAMALYLAALRPDPLLTAVNADAASAGAGAPAPSPAPVPAVGSAAGGTGASADTARDPAPQADLPPAERARRGGSIGILLWRPRALAAVIALVLSHGTMSPSWR